MRESEVEECTCRISTFTEAKDEVEGCTCRILTFTEAEAGVGLKFEILNFTFPWRPLLVLMALLGFGLPATHAQTKILRGGLQVENLSTPFSPHWTYGSGELRYRLTNVSSNAMPEVALSYPTSSYGGGVLESMRRSVALQPGETRTLSMPVPPLEFYSGDTVQVNYRGRKDFVNAPARSFRGTGHYHHSSMGGEVLPSVLVSHSLNHRDLQSAIDRVGPATRGTASQGTVKHELGMSEWSSNWMAYGHFDALVLSATDYDNLQAPAREAVHRYTELGGCLIVIGTTSLPRSWNKDPTSRTSDTQPHHAGLGRAYLIKGTKINDVRDGFWKAMLTGTWKTGQERNRIVDYNILEQGARVIDNLRIPVLPLFLLMLGFAILIGPINLWYLNRRKKRIWMLWTVPVISAITCGLVFLFSLLSEGVRPSRSTLSYTLLDQSNGHAATIGAIGVYAPLTPSRGFRFDSDTEVRPVSSSKMNGQISYGTDQHFSRGWARARVPIYFQLRRSETTKLRLQVQSVDKQEAVVVNGLGHPVEALWLTDQDGKVFHATDIAAGAKATLRPLGRSSKGSDRFAAKNLEEISIKAQPKADKLGNLALRHLDANQYLAVIESDNPMLPKIIKAKTKDDRALIHGLFTPPGTP